ncbi:hypothetical protein CH300_10240 [Rhodococcus sp. 15-1154-1]|nr:hypothetical protein CH300_10240 [Rhodococcus sp. 15-1154-1]
MKLRGRRRDFPSNAHSTTEVDRIVWNDPSPLEPWWESVMYGDSLVPAKPTSMRARGFHEAKTEDGNQCEVGGQTVVHPSGSPPRATPTQ